MSFDFEPLRARLEQRRDHELKQRTRAMSWRDRRDTVLYLIGGSAVVLVIVLSASLVHAGLDLGWFDRPPVRPAPDKRLDGNLRDDVDERPLTAAALHHGRLWVTQSGGTVHRYHPATELWSTAQLDPQLAIRSDLIAMRSGCGADPGSTRAGDCDDPGSLWALSAAGGLVRQRGDWSPVVGESAWLGPAGEPLRSSQLTTAAVSADRRWLLVGSRRQGVGLFDNRRRIWIPVPEEALPAPAVTHLRWWRGRFWIGGPGGLGYLIPGTRLRGKAVSEIAGNILDLDVAAGDGSLWILERHACANEPPGQECRRLTVLTHAYATPAERIAETHRYPAVDFANLSFAHQQGDPLVLAGSAGLYTYDARRHRWQQYLENRVSATLVRPDDALYFGSAGGALRLDEGRETTRWELDEEQVKRLRATPGDEVLALSADGDVDELRTDGSVARVFEAASTTFDPQSFSQAVEVGGKVLFLGRRGALIHDVRRRSYEDVYRGAVPWLFESDVELYGSGGTVFTVARQTRAQIRSARIGALEQVKDLGAVDGPVRLAVDWAAGGLGLLTEDGSVYRATATELRPVIGPPVELRHDQMRDVAVRNDALLVVGPTGLRRYDHNARSWGNWEGTEIARDGFREIELAGNRVLLRTADGRLAELGSDEPIRIGDDRPWKITDDQLSDVRLAGGLLYLAGGGRVHRYDPDRRRTTNRWQLRHAGDATVELIGFHPWGEQPSPVSWAAGRVYLGETALDEQAGPVDSAAFSSGTIRTVREGPGGQRYLKSYTGQSLSEDCVFLHPRGRGRVRDVAALLEGGRWLAMATTEDLQLYSHRARSWYEVRLGNRRVPGDSTIRLGSYLLVVDETGDTARLTFIQLGALKEPDSCAGRVFNVPNKFPTFPVRAWTVDPGLEAAAWIDLDGAVYRWQAGRREQLLVPPRGAPPSAALRRVYQLGGRLLLTTDDAVYSYRLSDHSWYRHRIPSPSGAARFVDLNLEPSPSERLTVTAHAGDGSVYVGQLHPGADNTVQLDRLLIPRARRRSGQGLNPERLRDVQEGPDGRWRFLFDDRLKSFDPSTRTWDRDLVFPAPADPTVTLRRVLDRDVLVKDSGRTWWIAQDGSERASAVYPRGSDRAAAIDRDGRVWRLPADGRVRRCTARGGSYDVCEDHGGADMLIDPQRIASAWELDDWILFVGAGGSRVYDREQHRELRGLPPAVSRVTVVQQALKSSGNHWLLVDDGRLLRLDRQKRWRSSRASRLAVDRRDNVWVRGPDGWRRWNGERFSDPLAGRQDLRMLDLVDAQTPAVIHRSGMIFRYESGRFTELGRLPGHLDPDAVRTVIRSAPGRSWWVHHGRDLVRLAPTSGAAAPDRSPEIELPSAEVEILTVAVREGGRFHLRFSDGSGWEIDELAKAGRPVSPPSRPYFRLSDQWPMLKRQILVRPDGRNVFDGVIDLDHHAKGQLVARRPSGDQLLTTGHTTLGLETPDAVDVGWLRWQRDDHSFRMRTSGDDRSFAPDELIQGGRLLMEEVVAVLARDERIYAANRHGVWIFEGGSPALDQPNVDYHEISLPGKIIAAHGRFLTLTPQRSLVVEDEDFERDSYPTHEATIGVYVRFNELVRGRRILGEITSTSGGTLDAFGDNGPRWDQRRGIAFAGDGLILLSDAGIHPLDLERAAFDPGPGNRALSGGRLRRGRDGELYFNDGTKWYRRQAGAWVPAAASDLQAGARVASRLWTWRWRDGRIEVSRRGDRQRFALHQGTDELYCTSDRLRAATVHDQDLFVLTDAFLEVAADPEQLAAGEARRLPPIRGRRLRSLRLRPRAPPELYLERDGEILRWSPDAESFVALASAAQNPYRQRWLAETKRLRFRTIGTQVVKELRLDLPEGGDAWKSFRFSTNGFPCDQVTALGALDERLFVHTRAGLQVFGRGGATGLASLDAFFHLGEKSANAVTDLPVRLGRPLAAADRFLIRSGERCWEWLDDRLGPCRSPASLGERLRGSNPLWQWSEYGGELRGVYQSRGHITSTPARLVEGRWPHDRLRSLAACRGRAASVWENRWISRHGGGELSLSTGEHDNRLAANDPDRLLCLHRPLPLRRGEVPAGLYAVLKTEIRRRAFDSWQLVAGAEAEALRKHLEDPPVLRYGDLRLRDSYRFEQRDRRGDWHPLEWRDRRVGIDRIDDLIVIGDVLWAVTPEGFVSFERARDGTLRLDPDNLTVVREPADAERLCTVTDLDFARDLDLASDDGVVVRCGYDSQRVFSGRLERAADTGIFEPCPGGDPFASRVLIKNEETGYWEWRLEGRRGGHPGTLSATLHKEPIALAGGRFDFDALSSMATFQPGRIELVGDGGWYQTPLDRLHVREFRRPPIELPIAPAAVTRVGVTRAENDERLLCLVGEPGSAFLLSAEEEDRGQIANCAEDLGRDTLWRYAGLHGELHIEAPGIAGGTARRAMRDGRFSDHRVTGLPATGVDDGEVFYLLPTEAAVIRLDEDAIPEALYAPPFAGMSPSTVPAVIYIDAQDGLVYVTSDGFYRARDGRKLAAMDDQVPEGSVMVALEDGPGDLLRIRWHRDGVAGWSLLRRKDYALDSYNRLPFNVGSWRSFKRRSTRWGQVDETLDLHLVAGGLDLRPRPPSGYVRRVWAYPLQPLTVVLSGQIALAVERDEVWEADLDRPMIELYNDIQDRP